MEEDEAELLEMEEDVPVDEDLFAYYEDDGYQSDEKGTLQDHEFNPKLVNLVISVVFMLATFTSVSQLTDIILTKVQLNSANWITSRRQTFLTQPKSLQRPVGSNALLSKTMCLFNK